MYCDNWYIPERRLARTVIDNTPEELSEYLLEYKNLCGGRLGGSNTYEMGLACRFCGVDTVKILVEQYGSSFFVDETKKETSYYQLYLLKIFRRGENPIKGADFIRNLEFPKRLRGFNPDKKYLRFLPDDERIKIAEYLFQNREKTGFEPEEVLFYAYVAEDNAIINKLKGLGVSLDDKIIGELTEGGASSKHWDELCSIIENFEADRAARVLKNLYPELHGKKFYFSQKIFGIADKVPDNAKLFGLLLDIIDDKKMNKSEILRGLIKANNIERLSIAADHGFLDYPRRLDYMTDYAVKNNKVECTAWLLDYKNRKGCFDKD